MHRILRLASALGNDLARPEHDGGLGLPINALGVQDALDQLHVRYHIPWKCIQRTTQAPQVCHRQQVDKIPATKSNHGVNLRHLDPDVHKSSWEAHAQGVIMAPILGDAGDWHMQVHPSGTSHNGIVATQNTTCVVHGPCWLELEQRLSFPGQ